MRFGPQMKPSLFTSPAPQPYREVCLNGCCGMEFKQLSTHGYARKALKASLLDELQFVTYGNGVDKYPVEKALLSPRLASMGVSNTCKISLFLFLAMMYRLPHSHSLARSFESSAHISSTSSMLHARRPKPPSQPCTAIRECLAIILMVISRPMAMFHAVRAAMVHAALSIGNAKAMASVT